MSNFRFLLVLFFSLATANEGKQDLQGNALLSVQRILANDELQCIPRLLCEQLAGGSPGQLRGLKVDTQSLFTLFNYLGLDTNSPNSSPMWTLAKALMTGITNRGDSYTCYQKYPSCPRDQTRLLHYLNNHRGGFFRGFNRPFYGRSETRIVNKEIYSRPLVIYSENDNSLPTDEKFIFGNRSPKGLHLKQVHPVDRLPNRLQFPSDEITNNVFINKNIGFFPDD